MLTKIRSFFPPHIKFILKLYALHICIFYFYRTFHFLKNAPAEIDATFFQKFMGFRMGLEFDTAVTGYILFIPVLLLSANYFFNYKFIALNKIAFLFFLVFMQVYQFVYAADIPYYNQFGNHVNKEIFLWKEEPGFAVGLIFGDIGYWGYFILFAATSFISIYFSRKIFKTYTASISVHSPKPIYITALTFVLLGVANVYAARGRTPKHASLHEGMALVSTNAFVNSIAINPNFTFWKSLFYNKNGNYVVPKNIKEYIAFTRNYLGIGGPFEENISRKIQYQNPKNYNVMVVIMESMSISKLGYYGTKNLTPHLSEIIKESVFFNHFFSSGIHTFNGLFSTNSGYPSILNEQPLKRYLKAPFHGFGRLLKEQGYETFLFTAHDPHFDNMSGFFSSNSIDKIVSEYDMPIGSSVSEFGVPDHILLEKVISEINSRTSTKPFASVVMTISDHGPWVIPDDIAFKPKGETKQENCTLYADWSLGKFLSEAKKTKWYENTIFIFLGDHGQLMGDTYEMPLSYNHIPFIVHHPASLKPDTNSNLGYQPDVTATIMGLLNRSYTNETFGINLFEQGHPFVMFSADNKIGCINKNGFYYYKLLDTDTKRLWKYETLDRTDYLNTYKSTADSLEYGSNAILETARYFVRNKHFVY